MKIQLNLDDLKILAKRAAEAGIESRWIEVALEWMEATDRRIIELEEGLSKKPLDRNNRR